MTDEIEDPQVGRIGLLAAAAATLAVGALFLIFEPELLWLGGVVAAGIWIPLATRDNRVAARWAVVSLIVGLVLLAGIVVWATS